MSHVFVAAFEIEPGVGRIEEARDSDGGVGQKTQELGSAVFEFRLKETTDHAAGEGEVVGRHVDAADHLFWKNGAVDPRDGPDEVLHKDVVDAEHRAVEALDGVVAAELFLRIGESPGVAGKIRLAGRAVIGFRRARAEQQEQGA